KDREFLARSRPPCLGKATGPRCVWGCWGGSEGTIGESGKVLNRVPSRNRDVAMVFQTYALYPHMSVFDNMAFSLRLQGVDQSDIARRVNTAAETVGLAPLLKRLPRHLSGGEQQRVALGRAIVRDPQLFLF